MPLYECGVCFLYPNGKQSIKLKKRLIYVFSLINAFTAATAAATVVSHLTREKATAKWKRKNYCRSHIAAYIVPRVINYVVGFCLLFVFPNITKTSFLDIFCFWLKWIYGVYGRVRTALVKSEVYITSTFSLTRTETVWDFSFLARFHLIQFAFDLRLSGKRICWQMWHTYTHS